MKATTAMQIRQAENHLDNRTCRLADAQYQLDQLSADVEHAARRLKLLREQGDLEDWASNTTAQRAMARA